MTLSINPPLISVFKGNNDKEEHKLPIKKSGLREIFKEFEEKSNFDILAFYLQG